MGEVTNTPSEAQRIKLVEKARIALCFLGVFLGHAGYYRLFSALVVFSLAGLTGLESLLIGDASARSKGWPVGSPYQRQSACGNLASALGTAGLLVRPRTERTDAALAATTGVVLAFIVLSGVNHACTSSEAKIHVQRFWGAASLGVSAGVVLYKWGAL